MWIIISYQYKEINTWIGVLPNTEKLLLRVLKENVTQQPSFDALLRHLYKKNSVFQKSDSSKKFTHTSYISIHCGLNLYFSV